MTSGYFGIANWIDWMETMAMADQGLSGQNTSEMLGECRKTLFNDDGDLYIMVRELVTKVTNMETKLTCIEQQTRTLQEVNDKLTRLTSRVNSSEAKITEIEKKVVDLEGN